MALEHLLAMGDLAARERRLFGEHLVGLTAESELVVSGESYRARSASSMRLPGAVVSEMAFTL
jgi:hypothetical protein